jgi:phosphate transport system substrate-binding protein
MAEELDYVPMPKKIVAEIEKAWSDIKDSSGKPLHVVSSTQ